MSALTRLFSIHQRDGRVFVLPNIGLMGAEPVFTSAPQKDGLAAALHQVFAAVPVLKTDEHPADYRGPVMELLKLRSGIAFERGLKSAYLEIRDGSYRFFRFFPLANFKRGSRLEEDPLFTMPVDTSVTVLAERILEALDDETWPTR